MPSTPKSNKGKVLSSGCGEALSKIPRENFEKIRAIDANANKRKKID